VSIASTHRRDKSKKRVNLDTSDGRVDEFDESRRSVDASVENRQI